jgi:hypothetical protein
LHTQLSDTYIHYSALQIYARIKAEPGLTLPEQFQQVRALGDHAEHTLAHAHTHLCGLVRDFATSYGPLQALTDILDGTTACASQVGVDPLQ